MCRPFGCIHSKAGEVIEPSNVFHSEKLHWPFRANYQGRECVVVACEESWSWFSVMRVNFLVVDFRFESEFQSSDCLQHTPMMLVYGSDLYSAPGSSLWGSVQLRCKKWLFKPWKGQVTDKTWQQFRNQFLAGFVRFPPGFGWFSQVLPGPERRQTDGAHCASMRRDDREF